MTDPPAETRRSRRRHSSAPEVAAPAPPDPAAAPDLPAPPLPVATLTARRRGEGLRGEGRRVSEASELHGPRRLLHVVTLPALACLLLIWALTTVTGDVHWGPLSVLPVAFACLSPLIILPAVPLATVAAQRRRWLTLVPTIVAAGLPWSFVVGYALPAAPPAGPTVPLRAMIVTAHDGAADAGDIAQAVASQRTDLLVVTELSSQLAHDLTLAGLPAGLTARWVSLPAPGMSPAAGIGIYSRFAVDRITPLTGTHWPAVSARLTVGTATVTLVAGHAVQPSADHLDRWRQDLDAFGQAARDDGPVLVLGNLNATPWNPQFRRLVAGRLHEASDVLGQGLRPTWPNWSPLPLLPADHALVAGVGVDEINALPIEGSDHRALSVGLSLPAH